MKIIDSITDFFTNREIKNMLTGISERLSSIEGKEDTIMADIANISADLDEIKAGVQLALTAIDELKAQIAAITPGAATQADLDALDAKTEEIKALLSPPAPPV